MKYFRNALVAWSHKIFVLLTVVVLGSKSQAADFTTRVNQPYNQLAQTWNDAIWEPGPVSPTVGNTYEVLTGGRIWSPPLAGVQTFPGDSLILDTDARIRVRAPFGTAIGTTLNFPGVEGNAGLVLNGGKLQADDDCAFTIAGRMAVVADSTIDHGFVDGSFVITAQIEGAGNLTLVSGSSQRPLDIRSSDNAYSGTWFIKKGWLKGTANGSLGTGNITIDSGAYLEVDYDIQTPGTLSLLGSDSVMYLRQDCQFGAVSINDIPLAPGTYTYAELVVRFPGNFASDGSGSITVTVSNDEEADSSATMSDPTTIQTAANLSLLAPTAPSGVMVFADSALETTIQWNPSTILSGTGLASYKVYRNGVLIAATTATSYTDTGLSPSTPYCYAITAMDLLGTTSTPSAQACITTLDGTNPLAPSVPDGVMAFADSATQVTVRWNASIDSSGLGLIRYRVSRNGAALVMSFATATSYTDSGLTSGTQYCYTIQAWYYGYGASSMSSPSAQACVTTPASPAQNSDSTAAFNEWYGPFASWDNVKTKYGAKGNGVADDTAAIQAALNNVGLGGNSSVLYFPNGTYRVTKKLLLKNRQHVEILGESRDGVVLKYDGATDSNYSGPSTLFHADGIAECHFARLTFDGNAKSKTVVSESQTTGAAYFDGGNSWEDCVFKNAASGGRGVDAGYFGEGFAGVNFVRCIFTNLSAGLVTGNWNALDGWLTDCYMVKCGIAIDIKTGSAHAYHTTFVDNQTDFLLEPAANFISLVSNVSYRSGVFFKANDNGQNLTPILLKGNTVIDPTSAVPIVIGQPGPVVMLDNVIANPNGAAVSFSNGMQVDLLAVGNTLTVGNWLSIGSGSGLKNNLVDNAVVARSSLALAQPPPPTPAANLNRTIVNLAAGFTTADLQNALNSAPDGAVIHIPWSSNADRQWYLTSTVTVPTDKDVRIVGDGPGTKLYWNGANGSPMFSCPHPSRATFAHLQLFGNSSGTASAGVQVSGVGSSSARVYLRDVSMTHPVKANVRLGDCPNTVIDYCSRGAGGADAGGSNFILDGRGKVRYINTEGGGATTGYICTNGGSLYVETCYNEAGDSFGQKIFKVSGASMVTFLSGKLVANIGAAHDFSRATSNGYAVMNFTGQLVMALEQGIIDWYNIDGATTGSMWIHGNQTVRSPVSSWPIINSTAITPVQTMNWNGNNGIQRYSDIGTASAAYIRQMLSQARAEYSDLSPMVRRANQTDVLLEHVFFELSQQNLWVKP